MCHGLTLTKKAKKLWNNASKRADKAWNKGGVYNWANYLSLGLVGSGKNLINYNASNWKKVKTKSSPYNIGNYLTMGTFDMAKTYFTSEPGSEEWFDSYFGIGAMMFGGKVAKNGGIKNKSNVLKKQTSTVTSTVLSNSSKRHIKKHSFEGMKEQAAHMTDEQLEAKLRTNTFFDKKLSYDQCIEYASKAYTILRKQNKTGRHTVKIKGELITVYIKENGEFDSAYGVHKYKVSDFR